VDRYRTPIEKLALTSAATKVAKTFSVKQEGIGEDIPFTLFVIWDIWAIATGHWSIDPDRTVGLKAFGIIPVEELIFFVVVPLASILSLEAVRSVRGWPLGDEAPVDSAGGDAR
jgi:hypothetical protein